MDRDVEVLMILELVLLGKRGIINRAISRRVKPKGSQKKSKNAK
jgi:hypothetical protein